MITLVEQSEPKILVIVGHALYEPWKSILYEGQLKTWAENPILDVRHAHAIPMNSPLRWLDKKITKLKWSPRIGKLTTLLEILLKFFVPIFKGNLHAGLLDGTKSKSLLVKIPDLDFFMNHKSFAIITGSLDIEFDYLVSVTSSSYLNLSNLSRELAKLPREKIVSGRILNQNAITFASGSFKVFSRDTVKEIAKKRKLYSKWRPEDLAYGYLLSGNEFGLQFINLPSKDIESIDQLNSMSENELNSIVHFRLKSGTFTKRNDVAIMHALHKRMIQEC